MAVCEAGDAEEAKQSNIKKFARWKWACLTIQTPGFE